MADCQIIPFPDRQHRAWVIRCLDNGACYAVVVPSLDPGDTGPCRTGVGSLGLVQDALRQTCNNRGLPVKVMGVAA
jgi:hypothetical protein